MTRIFQTLSMLLFFVATTFAQTPSDSPCNAPTIQASNTAGSCITNTISVCCGNYTNFLGSNPSCGTAQTNRDAWYKVSGLVAGDQYNFLYVETGNRQTWVEVFELPAGKDCSIPANYKSVKCARGNAVAFFPGSSVSATFAVPTASSSYYVRFQRVNFSDESLEGTFCMVKSYANEEPCTAQLLPVNPTQNTNPVFGNNITAADWKPEILTGPLCGPNNDVWYKFVPTECSVQIFIDNLSQTSYEMQAAILASADGTCNNLMDVTPCGGQPDKYLDITLTADNLTIGKTYYIIVDGYAPPYINGVGNYSIEVFKKPNAPACPNIASPCDCGDAATCGGTVLPNSAAGNAALATATTNPNANGCFNFMMNAPAPPLCGGNNTVEFCTKYTAVTGDALIAFDNVVGKDATCEVLSTKNIAYEEGVCSTPINAACLDYNGKSPVFAVSAGKTYKFCRQIVTNGGDVDCIGKNYQSYCAFLWKMPAASITNKTICNGESFQLGANTYTTPGTYTATVKGSKTGCDSTVTVNLTVLPASNKTLDVTLCNGQTYPFGGTVYTASGTYKEVVKTGNGCDSTTTLNLNILPKISSILPLTICAKETITIAGKTFGATGTYTVVAKTASNCDSTITLNLTVKAEIKGAPVGKTLCNGQTFTYNGKVYATTGKFDEVYKAKDGCDSTITVSIFVKDVLTKSISDGACFNTTYKFGTQNLTTSGTYSEVFKTGIGCDSTVTLKLTFTNKVEKTINKTLCFGETFLLGTKTLGASGTFIEKFPAAAGCDSIVTLNLTVLPKNEKNVAATICEGESYDVAGTKYNTSGTFTKVLPKASTFGCDSIIVLALTVAPKAQKSVSDVVCEGKPYKDGKTYTTSQTVSVTFPKGAKNGCDSTYSVILTVIPKRVTALTGTLCKGSTVVILGKTYDKAGTDQIILVAKSGCDSIVNITIIEASPVTASATTVKASCNEAANGSAQVTVSGGATPYTYKWSNGTTGTSITGVKPGNYMVTVTDTKGCSAVVTASIGAEPTPFTVTIAENYKELFVGDNAVFTLVITPPAPNSTLTWNPSTVTVKTGTTNAYQEVQTLVGQKSYTVTVKDANGCTATATESFEVKAPEFDVPTVFTPDSEDGNNLFKPYDKNEVKEITKFLVFNRWGEIVYNNASSPAWNGTYHENNGKGGSTKVKCPSDVYLYLIEYTSKRDTKETPATNPKLKGNTTLIR